MDALMLYSTWPDRESAENAARALIEAHLAGCVTLLPQAVSFYRWEGEIQADQEVVMLAKTTAERVRAAREAILARHPYDLPCVLALNIDPASSHSPYLKWLAHDTSGAQTTGSKL
jgi:periplasmic divalent cation tolerance protein